MQHTFHSQTQAEQSVTEGETGTGKERRLLGMMEYCMLRSTGNNHEKLNNRTNCSWSATTFVELILKQILLLTIWSVCECFLGSLAQFIFDSFISYVLPRCCSGDGEGLPSVYEQPPHHITDHPAFVCCNTDHRCVY